MADDTKNTEKESPDGAQTEPSEDKPSVQPDAVTDSPAKEQEQSEQSNTSDDLPDDASSRTKKEFEKMRSKLRAERELRKQYEKLASSPGEKQETTEKQAPSAELFDPETGYINADALTALQKQTLEAQQRAEKAEKAIQTYQSEQQEKASQQENQQVFTQYPELNPENKKEFSKEFHVETRKILLDSMLNPDDYDDGQLSFMKAAEIAKGRLGQTLESAKEEGAQEALDKLTPKEQASLDAVGSPSRRGEVSRNVDELRKRTRRGDSRASIERIKRIYSEG